jgi:aryl-alcohol dehydrogenase-like predicted oxidoreductase
MEYRLLGRSGLKISTITMGTMTFGRAKDSPIGSVGLKEAKRQIDQCMDAGVNLIDTADVYARGASEEIVGEALGKKRGDVLIATKIRFPMGDGPNDRGLSRHHIVAGCEASLKRLRTDWIDLYQVHQWDGMTPLEETMEALDRLVRDGKVRYIGCSNYSGAMLDAAFATTTRLKLTPFVSAQNRYSLLTRDIEQDLVPACLAHDVGVLPYFPLESGLLSGKYRKGQPLPPDSRFAKWRGGGSFASDSRYEIVGKLEAYGNSIGRSVLDLAIGWLAAQPAVTSVIAGVTKPAQLAQNVAAGSWSPTAEQLAAIRAIAGD